MYITATNRLNDSAGKTGPMILKDLGSPAVATSNAVHAAVTDTGEQVVVTTAITNPDYPRNITATSGGTAGDIKAIQVIIAGTNEHDVAITETLPVFTENTATTVVGNKAFKTVTSITIPAHDGTGATTAIGTGSKLGIGDFLSADTILRATINSVVEGTAPTVATSTSAIESNTVTLSTALNTSHTVTILYMQV